MIPGLLVLSFLSGFAAGTLKITNKIDSKKYEIIKNTKTCSIDNISNSLVKLKEKINSENKYISPISKIECIYYKVKVIKALMATGGYGNAGAWKYDVLLDETKFKDIYLHKNKIEIDLDINSFELEIQPEINWKGDKTHKASDRIIKFLNENNIKQTYTSTLFIEETIIEPDKELTIIGEYIDNKIKGANIISKISENDINLNQINKARIDKTNRQIKISLAISIVSLFLGSIL